MHFPLLVPSLVVVFVGSMAGGTKGRAAPAGLTSHPEEPNGAQGTPPPQPREELLPCNSKSTSWAQGSLALLALWGAPYFASHHSLSSSLLSTGDIVTLFLKDRPHLRPQPSLTEASCLVPAGENPHKPHYALSDHHPDLLCLTPMWKTKNPPPTSNLRWGTFHLKLHCWLSSPL